MGGEATMIDEPDPDARWKPGYEMRPIDPTGEHPAVLDDAARTTTGVAAAQIGEVGSDRPDPWSRAAATAPPPDWRAEMARRAKSTRRPIEIDRSAPVVAVEGQPASAVTGELVLGAVVVLAVLLVAAFVGRSLVPETSTVSGSTTADAVPRQVGQLWTAELDGRVASTSAGAGSLLVDLGNRVVAFDQLTGGQLWSREFAVEPLDRTVHVIDSTALVLDRQPGGTVDVVAVDARTGAERWSRLDAPDEIAAVDQLLLRFTNRRGGRSFETIDPVTGEAEGPSIGLGPADAPFPRAPAWDDGRVTLYDLETGERLGGPVDGLNLQSLDVIGATLVGFDEDGKVVVFDERGVRVDERRFVSDVFGDFTGRAQFVGEVPGHDLAIVSSGSSIGFTVIDERVQVVWEVDGRVGAPVETEIGSVSVARVIDGATGEVNLALVDATTGETITVTDMGVTREVDPIPFDNAYVVSPEVGASVRSVSAFGYDGQEWWSLPLEQFALYEVLDGSVLVVVRGPDRSTVTVYG